MTLKSAIRGKLLSTHATLTRRRPEAAVVLSCDPRSGSTWLQEILADGLGAATIWEPFHLEEAPLVRELGFGWRQHIPAEADWPEAEALVRRILSGQLVNAWTGSASRASDFLKARRLLVKCCRANAFLPWMVRRIRFEMRPIHFLRHPFAIAASQIRMGNFTGDGLRNALFDGRYVDQMAQHNDYILGLQSDEERIVAMWCRSQLPSLTDPQRRELWTTAHYETLLLDPEAEIERIFSEWGQPVPEGIAARVSRPSRMTQKGALKADAMSQVGKWQAVFPESKQRAMGDVLRHFGVTCYRQEPLPAP